MTDNSYKSVLQRLSAYQLAEMYFNNEDLSLNLKFSRASGLQEISITLFNIISMSLSKSPEDDLPCSVGMVDIYELGKDDDYKKALLNTGYSFYNLDGEIFLPDVKAYYFKLEGDICLNLIFGKYEIFKKD